MGNVHPLGGKSVLGMYSEMIVFVPAASQ